MKIWLLDTDVKRYNWLSPLGGWNSNLEFEGDSKLKTWTPLKVDVLENKPLGDNPHLSSGIPVFSKRALGILEDLIQDSTEILPILIKGFREEYYAVNVLEVIDCIDYEKSQFIRFNDTNRIMLFEKYEFMKDKIVGKHIFKIIDEPRRNPFVSDEFRNRVMESGLNGFIFDFLWESQDE